MYTFRDKLGYVIDVQPEVYGLNQDNRGHALLRKDMTTVDVLAQGDNFAEEAACHGDIPHVIGTTTMDYAARSKS